MQTPLSQIDGLFSPKTPSNLRRMTALQMFVRTSPPGFANAPRGHGLPHRSRPVAWFVPTCRQPLSNGFRANFND
jgi:hypothetical protein